MHCVTRLQRKVKNAAAFFQQLIVEMLRKLTGCVAYQDDTFLYGVTDAHLRKKQLFNAKALKGKQFTLNEKKSVSFTRNLFFLGYGVSSGGVQPDCKHTEKNFELQSPKNVEEIEAFIGIIDYFFRMIPKPALLTQCVNELRQKDKIFLWTDDCQRDFNQ